VAAALLEKPIEQVKQSEALQVKHLASFELQAIQFPVPESTKLPAAHSHSLVVAGLFVKFFEQVKQLFSSQVKHLASLVLQARQFPVPPSTYFPDGHSHSLVVEPTFGMKLLEQVVHSVEEQAVHWAEVLLQG
jgi:hypothetical protein